MEMFAFRKECLPIRKHVCIYKKMFGFNKKCLALDKLFGFKLYDIKVGLNTCTKCLPLHAYV